MSWVSGQAYSDDLRARVLAAVDRGGRVYELAPLFEVSVSYIYKALARRRDLGLATALPRKGRPGRKLDSHLDVLVARVKAKPDATLEELAAWVAHERGVKVCVATMWQPQRALRRPSGRRRSLSQRRGVASLVRGGRRVRAAPGDLLLRRRHLRDHGRPGPHPPRPSLRRGL